jgi:hypothetical protein
MDYGRSGTKQDNQGVKKIGKMEIDTGYVKDGMRMGRKDIKRFG